ncbi:MAG: GntR family transcriptional regulator [Eubacterium sp.]
MKLLNKDEFIANEIKYLFMEKKYKEGDKLPSERELSERYGVQRATVREAYHILEEEGIIEIRERSGRYMGHTRIKNNLQEIKSFSDKLSDIGMEVKNKLISFEIIELDKELYKKVKLPIGTAVYKITRIRNVIREEGTFPIAIEYSYIPEKVAEKLFKYDLEENSLFEILRMEYGKVPQKEDQVIEIVYANEFEARTLKVDQMTALIKKHGITYDKDGNILQYLHSVMNKDWVEFEKGNKKIEEKIKEAAYGL